MAVFRAVLEFTAESQPKHVHADRTRNGRGVFLQRGGDTFSATFSCVVSPGAWRSGGLFRGLGSDRHVGGTGAGAGVARAAADEWSNPGATEAGTADGAFAFRRR